MAEAFIGQITLFAGNFAPRGWAFCEGQILPINQNVALFSILGTTYGGDGRTNFALPDLRGRVPAGVDYAQARHVLGAMWGGQAVTPYSAGKRGQTTPGNLGLNYIICLNGIFPSRG